MLELKNTKIMAVDHGYGNMKTANTVTPTGTKAYKTQVDSKCKKWYFALEIKSIRSIRKPCGEK